VLLRHLQALRAKIELIASLVQSFEWRIYGGSLLIIYEGSEQARPGATVKLIDFAHARHLAGQGQDPGVAKGLESILNLLSGRIAEVEAL
jgi:1D-myo-inositol-tetrakisphosphate 5-kinase/inositol-polyphosphate multikinase